MREKKGRLNGAVQVVNRPPKIIFRSKWKCWEIESSLTPPLSVFYRAVNQDWAKKIVSYVYAADVQCNVMIEQARFPHSIQFIANYLCNKDHPVYSGHASRYENWELLSVTFSVHWSVNQFIPLPRRVAASRHSILEKCHFTGGRKKR